MARDANGTGVLGDGTDKQIDDEARLIAAQGVQAVLTGHYGPSAYRALHAAGVRVYTGVAEGTVQDAVKQFQAGLLQEAAEADVQPHW